MDVEYKSPHEFQLGSVDAVGLLGSGMEWLLWGQPPQNSLEN